MRYTLLLLLALVVPLRAQKGVALRSAGGTNEIIRFDTAGGQATVLSNPPVPLRAITNNPYGLFYTLDNTGHIGTVDRLSGAYTQISSGGLINATGICYDWHHDRLWILETVPGVTTNLWRYSTATNAWFSVAPNIVEQAYWLAYGPEGDLWYFDIGTLQLGFGDGLGRLHVDAMMNVTAEDVANVGSAQNFVGASFDDSGLLLGMDGFNILNMNLETGIAQPYSFIHPFLQWPPANSLTWDRHAKGTVYWAQGVSLELFGEPSGILSLIASGLPPGELAIPVHSPLQGFYPLINGPLVVGVPFVRLGSQIVDGDGVVAWSQGVTGGLPGTATHFQVWHTVAGSSDTSWGLRADWN